MSHIHIPDGVLPVWLWAAGWAIALIMVGVAGRFAGRTEVRRKVPLVGIVAALMIVSMSAEIVPIAYHVNLSVVGGIILGPVLSVIAAFIVTLVLAMFGHGGVTVLGLNTMVIGAEMIFGWALFHAILKAVKARRAGLGAGVATVVTLALTTTLVVGIVWLAGAGEATRRDTGALDPATLRFDNPFSHGIFGFGLFHDHDHGHGHDDEHDHDDHDHAHDEHDHAHDEHDHAHDDEHAHAHDHDDDHDHDDEHAASHGHDDDHDHGHSHDRERHLSVGRFALVVYTLGPIGWTVEALVTAGIVGYVARVRPRMVFEGALAEEMAQIPGDEAGRH